MNAIRKKLPLRIIKTCLSLFISYATLPLIAPFTPFFAGIGAMKAMRKTMALSVETLREQTLANVIGMVVAIIFGVLFGTSPLVVTLAVFTLFMILKKFDWKDSYVMAAITMTSIMLLATDTQMLFDRGFDRVFATLYGMIIAFLVNFILFRPNYVDEIKEYVNAISVLSHRWLKNGACRNTTLIEINTSLLELNELLELVAGEYKFNKAFLLRDEQHMQHLGNFIKITKRRSNLMAVITEYPEYNTDKIDVFISTALTFEMRLIHSDDSELFDENLACYDIHHAFDIIIEDYLKDTVHMLLESGFEIEFIYALKKYIETVDTNLSIKENTHEIKHSSI